MFMRRFQALLVIVVFLAVGLVMPAFGRAYAQTSGKRRVYRQKTTYVKPHIRKGRLVKGYFRSKPQKKY